MTHNPLETKILEHINNKQKYHGDSVDLRPLAKELGVPMLEIQEAAEGLRIKGVIICPSGNESAALK